MTNSPDLHSRTMLPIPDRPAPGLTTYDAKDPDTSFPPIEPLLPPEGAPNVLIVLLDDVGFGASSAFGGPDLRTLYLGCLQDSRIYRMPSPVAGARPPHWDVRFP